MPKKPLKLLSWNVNGLRAVLKKGFLDFLDRESPDILCLQETKAQEEQVLPLLPTESPYRWVFRSAERKGYSGVALAMRTAPLEIGLPPELGDLAADPEGRIVSARFPGFRLFNVYFPNGKSGEERLRFKMDFYRRFLDAMTRLTAKGEGVVVCGDVNTAHKEIDLARPKENRKISGFLPEECAWMDEFAAAGFHDTLRLFDPSPGLYTWWDMKSGARARNVGWRIDYFFVSDNLKAAVKGAAVMPEVAGSDHCPVSLSLAA